MTTPSKDGFAVFEQDGNKCPILNHGELNTEIFCDFVTGCPNFVTNQEIVENKQTIKVMMALKGYIWEDWVSVHYDELRTLSLTNFLQCFKTVLGFHAALLAEMKKTFLANGRRTIAVHNSS